MFQSASSFHFASKQFQIKLAISAGFRVLRWHRYDIWCADCSYFACLAADKRWWCALWLGIYSELYKYSQTHSQHWPMGHLRGSRRDGIMPGRFGRSASVLQFEIAALGGDGTDQLGDFSHSVPLWNIRNGCPHQTLQHWRLARSNKSVTNNIYPVFGFWAKLGYTEILECISHRFPAIMLIWGTVTAGHANWLISGKPCL